MNKVETELLDLMRRAHIPLTRENYIDVAFDEPPTDAEAETLIPEQFQIVSRRADARMEYDEDKHPRDDRGRWTESGGGDESGGRGRGATRAWSRR